MSESLWRRTIEAQRKVKTWNEHLVEEQIEDTWQAQVDAGVALAEMAGRVRELEDELGEYYRKWLAASEHGLKVQRQLDDMTLDRDIKSAQLNSLVIRGWRADEPTIGLGDATPDEQQVIAAFVAKVMGEGRKEYGPLNLSTDKRTAEQLRAEQRDEWLDSEFYGIVAGMKAGL